MVTLLISLWAWPIQLDLSFLDWGLVRLLAFLADTSIIFAVVKWLYDQTYCTTYLKINGEIKKLELRKKFFSVQHLTNIVSREYYQGGQVDNQVRAEIIRLTSPRLKDDYPREHCSLKLFHRAYVHKLVKEGKAVDLSSGLFNEKMLNIRDGFPFSYEGVYCSSLSSLLLSLSCSEAEKQVQLCKSSVTLSRKSFNSNQFILYWKGKRFLREGSEYAELIKSILEQLYRENSFFQKALLSTQSKKIFYSKGANNPKRSYITERELCNILMQIRDSNTSSPS